MMCDSMVLPITMQLPLVGFVFVCMLTTCSSDSENIPFISRALKNVEYYLIFTRTFQALSPF